MIELLADLYSTIHFFITRWCQNSSNTWSTVGIWLCTVISLPVVTSIWPTNAVKAQLLSVKQRKAYIFCMFILFFILLFIHDSGSEIMQYSNFHNYVQKKHFYYQYLSLSIWTTGYHLTAAVEIGWIFTIPTAEAIVWLC